MISGKKRISGEERRAQILKTACSLFAKKGYDKVTTKQIAAKIGVSEALIFQHFSSKEKIFIELFKKWSEMVKIPVALEIVNNSAIETLKKFAEDTIQKHWSGNQRDMELIRAIASNYIYRDKSHKAILEGSDLVRDTILPVIEMGQKTGEIRKGDPLILASSYNAWLYGVSWMKENFPKTFEVPPVDLCLDMLRTRVEE